MPTFFDFYREKTGDTRADDDIALDFIREHPEEIDRIPELRAKAAELRKLADEQFPVTAGDVAKNVVGSATRSFFGGLADIPESIAVLNAEVDRKMGWQRPDGDRKAVTEYVLDPLTKLLRSTGEALAPEADPRLEDSFWANKVPGYVGSAASFAATGGAAKLANLGARAGLKGLALWTAENAPIALAGAASSAVGSYKEALAKGADQDTAFNAYLANLPIGATEIVPLGRMLRRLDGVTGGTFNKALVNAAKDTFEEAAQEAVQGFASNYVAQKLYDKDRNLLQDLQENAAGGGVTGFLFSALTQAIGGALGRRGGRQQSSGDSTETGDPGSGTTTPPPFISGQPPLAAGQPPAPAGPVASPNQVIAPGMEALTGNLNDEDRLALQTWAQQDVAGTLGVAGTAERDGLFQRNPQLASAYSIYREQAAQAATHSAAPAPEAIAETPAPPPPPIVPPAPPAPAPAPAPPEPQPVSLDDLISIARSVLERVTAIPNPTPTQQQTGQTLYAMLSNPAGPDFENLAAMLDLRLDDAATMPGRFVGTTGTQDTGERFIRPYDGPRVPANPTIRPEPQPPGASGPVGSDTGATRPPRIPQPNPTAWQIRDRALRRAAGQPVPVEESVAPAPPAPPAPTSVTPAPPVTEAPPVVPPPAPPAPPAAPDPFSRINEQEPDYVDLEGLGINELDTVVTRKTGVLTPVFDKDLKRVLNKDGTPKMKSEKDSLTQRITFFEDTTTGEVFGVGTYQNTDKVGQIRTAYVGRTPFFRFGMPLRIFLHGGTTGAGGRDKVPKGRFKALDTYRVKPFQATDPANAIRYPGGRAEYEEKWKGPAGVMIESLAGYEGGEHVTEAGEFTGAPREVTKVDPSATPDEVLAAKEPKEGFTPDDAAGIFEATKALIPTASHQEIGKALASSRRALAGVKKMLTAIVSRVENDPDAAARMLLQWIYEAKTISKGSQAAFVDALTKAVTAEVPGDPGGGGAKVPAADAGEVGQDQGPGGGTAGSLGAAGANPSTIGAGGQGTQGGIVSETDEVRLHTAPAGLPATQVTEAYRATLFSAAQQGLDVTVVQQGVDAIAEEVSGVYGQQAGQPMAVVTANDLSNPSIESLYVLTAEVAHHVFAGLPAAEQARLQRAVRGVTDGLLGIGEGVLRTRELTGSYAKGADKVALTEAQRLQRKLRSDADLAASMETVEQGPFKGQIPFGEQFTSTLGDLTETNTEVADLQDGAARGIGNAVVQEERLVDATVRSLVAEGFNPAEARGVAQALWRAIKDLMLRVARVLHGTWMGATGKESGEAGARMAQAYFENRVRSWLAGDARLSFVDFMGGGKAQAEVRNRWFAPAMGSAAVNFRWNPEAGEIEVTQVLPETIDAAVHNIEQPTMRFHRPGDLYDRQDSAPDTGVGAARSWIAAHNEEAAVITSLWNNFQATGHNVTSGGAPLFTDQVVTGANGSVLTIPAEEGFATWLLGPRRNLPQHIITAENEALTRTGKAAQDPALRMGWLNADTRGWVAAKTLDLLNPLKTAWENRYNDAKNEGDVRQRKRDRTAIRVVGLTAKYTDAEFLFSEMMIDVNGWLQLLKEDARKAVVFARKDGVLAEMIRQIEGRFDEKLGTQYAHVIERLAKRFGENAEGRTRFVVTLQKIAEMPAYFGESDTATIKEWITGNPDPALNVLRENSEDGRALLAIAAAFAKSNALMMHTASLRAAGATNDALEERAVVNDAMKGWLSSNRDHVAKADRGVDKLVKYKSRALQIKADLEQAKREQRSLDDQIEQDKRFMAFWEDSSEVLRVQMTTYENVAGAGDMAFEAAKGNKYRAPQSATADPRNFTEREYNPRRDGTADAQLKRDMQAMRDWLARHDYPDPLSGGRDYNRMSYELKKLEENEMQGETQRARRSMIQSLFGNVAVKLDDTGNPAAKAIARMYRDWTSWHYRYQNDAEVWAGKWALTERDAMRALKVPNGRLEQFRKRWVDPANNFIERRMRDVLPESSDAAAALNRAMDEAMLVLGVPIPARTALKAHWQQGAEASFKLNGARAAMGVPIHDDALGLFRDTKSAKGAVYPKRLAGMFHRMYVAMQGEPGTPGPWAGEGRLNPKEMAAAFEADPAAAGSELEPYFAGDIWTLFVSELANRTARSAFKAPADSSGYARMATVEETRLAFEATAPGDVLGFVENLAAQAGGQMDAAFVEETLDTFNQFFGMVHNIKQQQSAASKVTLEPVSEMLMNSRMSDEMPQGWVEYRPMDLHNVRSVLNTLTFHAAFGRNMEAAGKLYHQAGEDFKAASTEIKAAEDAVGAGGTRAAVAAELASRGLNLKDLETQAKLWAMLDHEQEKLAAWAGSQGGVAMEFKPWAALVSAAVSTLLQGPKTAITDTTSLFKPFQIYGFSATAFRESLRAIKSTAVLNVGGVAELFGKTLKWESDNIRLAHENGIYDSTMQATLPQRWFAASTNMPATPGMGILDTWRRWVWLGATRFREVTRTGLRIPGVTPGPEALQFPRFNPLTPFTQLQRTMPIASSVSGLKTFQDAVTRAAAWLRSNPTALNDPTFVFTPDHAEALGYTSKLVGLLDDRPAFEAILGKLNGYGHTLESLAKDLISRGGGPALNDRAYTRLMIYGPTELLQDSSMLTRVSSIYSSPGLRANLPFIGWSMAQFGSLPRGFQSQFGAESDMTSLKRGMTGLTALIGVGMAYALLRDFYDEELLNKKSNRLTFKDADTPQKVAAAALDKLSAVGTFGLMGDLANSTVNISTAREFTIDSRVFAINSFQQFYRSMGVLYHQGGTATYATVGRPLVQVFGGAGAIEQLQVLNAQLNRMGADVENVPVLQAEARVTKRINANNWLRVAGRGLNLEVRTGRGASDVVPNKATPYVREMGLAALGNDASEFADAYRSAVLAAREEGKPDPQDYVKRSFESQHPLRAVFKTQLSEADVRRILAALPEDGRQDVMEAVRLWNRWGERAGAEPYWGKEARVKKTTALRSISDVLRSQARLPSVAGF